MKLLSFKNKIHKSVNTIFYIIILSIGFIIGLCFNKIDYNKLLSQVLMIDSAKAYTIINDVDESKLVEMFSTNEDFDITLHHNILCFYYSPNLICHAISDEALNNFSFTYYENDKYRLMLNSISSDKSYSFRLKYNKNDKSFSIDDTSTWSTPINVDYYTRYYTLYTGFIPSGYESNSYITSRKLLDFSEYEIPPIQLDPQVNTWNGYGYDFYTNQVGILDMRKDTYIVNSHTCPNDGEFVTGYDGQTKDICSWSYYSDLSDFLVFYFNGRIYDSENVEWSNITFLKDHTYSLSFTLYGLVPQEQLYSIQFSLEGELTQEIYSSNFGKVLTDSLDSRTYLTFSITPTEDITFDHFFLKYFTNGSYAQTVGASRLWVYNDYTGLSEDAMQIIQTDKLLSQNQALKDLINNPFVNKDNVDSFWNNFKQDDFGLTQIVTLPLTTIKKISNGTCTPLNINILGKTIQLPCGDTLFWNREDIKDFKVFWNMIFGGILCYGIAISIYKDIHKAQSPMNDKLEVIDL